MVNLSTLGQLNVAGATFAIISIVWLCCLALLVVLRMTWNTDDGHDFEFRVGPVRLHVSSRRRRGNQLRDDDDADGDRSEGDDPLK
jgi:hypothetical protein